MSLKSSAKSAERRHLYTIDDPWSRLGELEHNKRYTLGCTPTQKNMQIADLHRLAQAASLAYLSIDKIPSSPYYQTSQLQPLLQVVDPQSEAGATVFLPRSADDNSVVVAFRGSANFKNFGTNLKFNLVPATKLSRTDVPADGLVHEGFQDASMGLWGVLRPKLLELFTDEDSIRSKDVVFTGHSLGAGSYYWIGIGSLYALSSFRFR